MALALLLAWAPSGCSVRRIAVNRLADALAESGTTFARDDDPELVKQAVPFSLKVVQNLLEENPRHAGLLLAASRGFTQYAYAFCQVEASEMEDTDLAASERTRIRAQRLYARARNYGLRGLELSHSGFEKALRADPPSAVRGLGKSDVPFLYWTAASWGALMSISKDKPEVIADVPLVSVLLERALALDEAFDCGALHSFMVIFELIRQGVPGDPVERARTHFDRAMELAQGRLAGPLVTWAENVSIYKQNVTEFKDLLNRALAVDIDAAPDYRLENLIHQRRARWLLDRADDLFLPPVTPPKASS
jgi:predicted anti-sigma-YlaC factor YlaD